MIPETSPAISSEDPRVSFSRVLSLASIVFFGVLPALALVALFADAIRGGAVAVDFQPFYHAGDAILRGENPYPSATDSLEAWARPYVYPPLGALLAMPLTALPLQAAGLAVMAALTAAALSTLFVLEVRDWRCYGLVLLWPPVISAIQTGNPTLLLALAAALVWRFRGRLLWVGTILGLTLAVKFFLWPLVVWLAATRRFASAVIASAVGAGLLLLSWAAIGFAGFLGYPDLLRRLEQTVGSDAYTTKVVALDLGASSGLASAVWLAFGLVLLAAVVLVARRGDERSAFILALAAAFALSPLVWLHYFAFLAVVVALAQPSLGPIWFVPFAMFLTPGSGNATPFETAWTLATAALTFALALRVSRREFARGELRVPRRAPAQVA